VALLLDVQPGRAAVTPVCRVYASVWTIGPFLPSMIAFKSGRLYDPRMLITKREWPVVIVNLIYVPVFTAVALRNLNFEFLMYVGVVLIVGGLILWKQHAVRFDLPILWGLTIWGLMHLAGGNVRVGGEVLYNLVLVPLVSEPYNILRYDQVVHTFGFGVATLVCHHLVRPYLREGIDRWGTLSFLIVLMGSGFGAINEAIEFLAQVTVPETNVGGYENTALDLVCNLIGGVLAVTFLAWRRKQNLADST
jgi:putative membrane protein